jgi:hypothetical protein
MIDFNLLIPELKEWNNGEGIDVESWIGCVGSFEKAIGYSVVFWPHFVEYDGCILKDNFSRESYDSFMKQHNGDKTLVEAVMNHLHIKDIQCYGCFHTKEQLIYIGNVLKEIYTCKLKAQFPEKQFEVKFENYEENEDDYEVTFYQKRQRKGDE